MCRSSGGVKETTFMDTLFEFSYYPMYVTSTLTHFSLLSEKICGIFPSKSSKLKPGDKNKKPDFGKWQKLSTFQTKESIDLGWLDD